MLEFSRYIFPYFNTFELVVLNDEDIEEIDNFVSKLINRKLLESHHKKDSGMEYKRWTNGILGERAVEKYINKRFIDFNIGNSNLYHISDMSKIGIQCGIKTVEIGKFPIIFKQSKMPEIIVIKETDYNYYICGVAKTETLNEYQSEHLIRSENLKKRGTKTAFYGFEYLISPKKLKKRFSNEIHS